jgi:RNA polymerase sigma-70 factor, ECF subfamily
MRGGERDAGWSTESFSAPAPVDHDAEFERHRGLLFSLAYRMLGSVADAEDVVQDAWLRWRGGGAERARAPREYLCATVTRLAVDHLRSARVRRERYVGPWLPEPLVEPLGVDPLEPMEMAESLTTAFLLLLERLSPVERAVFLLREVFSFEYEEVARAVGRAEANCRQIAKRARDRLAAGRPRFDASTEEAERIAGEFLQACASGEMDEVLALLAPDAVSLTDGGGRVVAARRPILGAERTARFWLGLARKGWAGARVQPVRVNGGAGFVVRACGQPERVLSFSIRGGRIHGIFVFSNPDRLGWLPPEN